MWQCSRLASLVTHSPGVSALHTSCSLPDTAPERSIWHGLDLKGSFDGSGPRTEVVKYACWHHSESLTVAV